MPPRAVDFAAQCGGQSAAGRTKTELGGSTVSTLARTVRVLNAFTPLLVHQTCWGLRGMMPGDGVENGNYTQYYLREAGGSTSYWV